MKIMCFYGPHFLGDAYPTNHPHETALLEKTDWLENFCIPLPGLTEPFPVGSVVSFTNRPRDEAICFTVVEVFYRPDEHPDIVFLRLQLERCDDVNEDELLAWLRKRHDTSQEYDCWA